MGGVSYGLSKSMTNIFADKKIFGVLGNLSDNTKVNKRLAKAGFSYLKIGKHGLNHVYHEMYKVYGFNTIENTISIVYDIVIGVTL